MAVAVDSRGVAYREAQAAALRVLRVRHAWLSQDERLEIYNDVWARLLERERDSGFWPDDLEDWLIGAVDKRALREGRTRASRRTDPAEPLSAALSETADSSMEERVHGQLDAENLHAVIAGLSPLQRTIAKLRFDADWQLAPAEIASVLEIDVERCYREIEYATERLRGEARKVQQGRHVRRYETVLRRYLAGTASDAERDEALRLLETSSQARAIASEMHRQALELGALLPAPVLAAEDPRSRVAELIVGVKEQLVGAKEQAAAAASGAKQHAASAYYRAVDPTPLSGVRPGAAATAIAGCLALGGGTAVCVEEGINPIKEVTGIVAPEEEQSEPPLPPSAPSEGEAEAPILPAPATPLAPEPTPGSSEDQPAPPPTPADPNAAAPAESGAEFLPAPGAQAAPAGGGSTSQAAPPQGGGEFAP